jgi:4-hydroxybenzoate polyprenyltransferase
LKSNSSFIAWLQLLRLPNVFTAVADVTMGQLFVNAPMLELLSLPNFIGIVVASCLLYLSGMVLNDVFDADIDAVEQPHRPIPSGRVSRSSARAVGWGMLIGGVAIAWYVGFNSAVWWRPGVVAFLLASCILLYNGALKKTRFAPLLMGECRFLNVLLGMSLSPIIWGKPEILVAAGIGIYISGVTIFSRTDAHVSTRTRLLSGFIVLMAGIALLAATPHLTQDRPHLESGRVGWYILWSAVALLASRRCLIAVMEPSPQRVQAAVRYCVQAVIVLDAVVCYGYAGPYWGFAVLSLLLPTLALTMWLNAT